MPDVRWRWYRNGLRISCICHRGGRGLIERLWSDLAGISSLTLELSLRNDSIQQPPGLTLSAYGEYVSAFFTTTSAVIFNRPSFPFTFLWAPDHFDTISITLLGISISMHFGTTERTVISFTTPDSGRIESFQGCLCLIRPFYCTGRKIYECYCRRRRSKKRHRCCRRLWGTCFVYYWWHQRSGASFIFQVGGVLLKPKGEVIVVSPGIYSDVCSSGHRNTILNSSLQSWCLVGAASLPDSWASCASKHKGRMLKENI